MTKCPICEGEGGWSDDRGIDGYEDWDDCGFCGAAGSVPLTSYWSHWFWTHLPQRIWEWYADFLYRKEEVQDEMASGK